jgi:glc operon protein GlcG
MAKLRAAECREFIKAVVEKAEEMGVPILVAVVGPEGHLIAVERMDNAGFITPDTAIAKAFTVAAFRSMSPGWAHAPESDEANASVKAHINELYAKAGIKDRL